MFAKYLYFCYTKQCYWAYFLCFGQSYIGLQRYNTRLAQFTIHNWLKSCSFRMQNYAILFTNCVMICYTTEHCVRIIYLPRVHYTVPSLELHITKMLRYCINFPSQCVTKNCIIRTLIFVSTGQYVQLWNRNFGYQLYYNFFTFWKARIAQSV